jgi:hypothetical protein
MQIPSLVDELAGVDLGDARLTKRMLSVVKALQARPDVSYPAVFWREADLEGFYRLMSNENVHPDDVLAPHRGATIERAAAAATVLVLHDSTEVVHAAGNEGRDFYELQDDGHYGYVAHVGLCVSFPECLPLGVVHLECVERADADARKQKKELSKRQAWKDPDKESLRWVRGVTASGKHLPTAIHVADREGDSFEFLSLFAPNRFVVRGAYDRRVIDGAGTRRIVLEVAEREELLFCRKSALSARQNTDRKEKKHPSRPARVARLGVSAASVSLVRPTLVGATSATGSPLPRKLPVNVVYVREIDPPEGEAPVEWLLYTTEPIDTPEQVAAVVDIYRARWIIEEFFKALKTGCAFSRRQFESRKTSQTALALTLPVAWRLLLLRGLERTRPRASAATVLSEDEIVTLAALLRRPRQDLATVADVLAGLARLGGHIRSNGRPGWQVLGRGWLRLLEATAVARTLAGG